MRTGAQAGPCGSNPILIDGQAFELECRVNRDAAVDLAVWMRVIQAGAKVSWLAK